MPSKVQLDDGRFAWHMLVLQDEGEILVVRATVNQGDCFIIAAIRTMDLSQAHVHLDIKKTQRVSSSAPVVPNAVVEGVGAPVVSEEHNGHRLGAVTGTHGSTYSWLHDPHMQWVVQCFEA